MKNICRTLLLCIFINSAIGDKEFFDNLKDCVSKTKEALSDKQMEDLDNIRAGISRFPGVQFDEPMFKVNQFHFDIAMREYLFSKKRVVGREKREADKIKLEEEIRQACKIVTKIWTSLFADYYLKKALKLLTFEDLKNGDTREYEMLLNAGVCYNGFYQSSV